ncbi:MAG TPA: sodium:proton antiporter [Porticoccaceae bacterium]|nr:sodium:proton antiporter [Porticoccaceae bacterium]
MDPATLARHTLLELTLVLGVGVACAAIARRIDLPDIVLYLIVGMLLGPAGAGWLTISAGSAANQAILVFGAAYLIFDGGATLRWRVLREVWISVVSLATVGVAISIAVVGAAGWLWGLPLLTAVLIGCCLSSTDPATLVPIFKQVPIRPRLAQTVTAESAFNDASGAIATLTVAALALGEAVGSPLALTAELAVDAGGGIAFGVLCGALFLGLVSPQRLGIFAGFAPVGKMVAVLLSYLGAEHLGVSGFMAVFVLGIMVGNRMALGASFSEQDVEAFESFLTTLAVILRILVFVLLGSQIDFDLLAEYWLAGLVLVLVLMFVARPLVVLVCCAPDRRARWTQRELLFMCWTRETGVIPAALAGMLLGMGVPGARAVGATVLMAILLTILIQASSTRWLAARLGLLEPVDEGGSHPPC